MAIVKSFILLCEVEMTFGASLDQREEESTVSDSHRVENFRCDGVAARKKSSHVP
jgi:hypothetical protein